MTPNLANEQHKGGEKAKTNNEQSLHLSWLSLAKTDPASLSSEASSISESQINSLHDKQKYFVIFNSNVDLCKYQYQIKIKSSICLLAWSRD